MAEATAQRLALRDGDGDGVVPRFQIAEVETVPGHQPLRE